MFRAVLAAALVGFAFAAAPTSAQESCDASKSCCVDSCSGDARLPTAAECTADACACAQKLHCVIEASSASWELFPGSVRFQPTTRPVHGRYMTITVNETAKLGLASNWPGQAGPAEMPDGSVIVKVNFPPDPSEPGKPNTNVDEAAITTMVKLDGYCPDKSGATDQCVGGDWYFLLRVGDMFPVLGKPGGCVNCHAAAEDGDWLWRLFAARRFSGTTPNEGEN